MPVGRFPHYTAKLITDDDKTIYSQWPNCQVCKRQFRLNQFVLCETKPVLVNGRVAKTNHRWYSTYQVYYHPRNCFGFYMSTVKDDKKRIQRLRRKHGSDDTTDEYDEAYNDLLNRRFENYDLMSETNQTILQVIMEKGEYKTDRNKTNSDKRKLDSDDDSIEKSNKKRKTITI
ncbi:unnamed protein product [Didymodactylos carnosus]|uniref:Uncharacterized protein n=1 Tax=Didymodactylos carnosus TaxID=1234261 RepID=A0A813XQU4_9BILA|nr:unnamed protein product [Didymodactylos carnosus]CAF0870437.1 unnamed protein product [Didymodactylos carnosus]CAF3589285.1 unnamed protein product [Didymodactylos carnosus]CAF3657764.1 unnamed protein product [Didymodactylos carnosus]